MKFAWCNNIPDLAAWNSSEAEEINIGESKGLLGADHWQDDFDQDFNRDHDSSDMIIIE